MISLWNWKKKRCFKVCLYKILFADNGQILIPTNDLSNGAVLRTFYVLLGIGVIVVLFISFRAMRQVDLEGSEPKWVNPLLIIIGVNSLRLGGLQLYYY